jgi:hypothetical protein
MLTIRPVAEYGTSDSIRLRFVDGTVGRVGLTPHVGCTGEIRIPSEFFLSKIQRPTNKGTIFIHLMTLLVVDHVSSYFQILNCCGRQQ